MFRARVLRAALCLLPVAAGRAWAQTPAPLTIDRAVAEAIDHNLALAAERYDLAMADARVLTAALRPNPVLTASVMLPDATIFNSNINPREGIVRGDVLLERGGKRERRMEVAQEARGVVELQQQDADPHADPQRSERLHRRPAGAGRSAAGAGIARRLQRDRRDQHGARAIGRPRAGRARAIAPRGAAVPERRQEPRNEAGGREPPAPRAARTDRLGADRGRRRAAPGRHAAARRPAAAAGVSAAAGPEGAASAIRHDRRPTSASSWPRARSTTP